MFPDLSRRRHNLPAQASSFIGRQQALGEIGRRLRLHRLVTLTGAGGAGKTRLALQAVAAELDRFADGVWLVELAPLASSELVVETIAKVLAMPEASDPSPLDGLSAFLRAKQLLLVLDNCEHLIAACAHIAAHLLARCPDMALLATSHEALDIAPGNGSCASLPSASPIRRSRQMRSKCSTTTGFACLSSGRTLPSPRFG
ncbi:MAG TPA: NB-ARC domain-containing protein [Ktedonobacterales bacterium]